MPTRTTRLAKKKKATKKKPVKRLPFAKEVGDVIEVQLNFPPTTTPEPSRLSDVGCYLVCEESGFGGTRLVFRDEYDKVMVITSGGIDVYEEYNYDDPSSVEIDKIVGILDKVIIKPYNPDN